MDSKRQGEIITQLFEMFFGSKVEQKIKGFEKILKKVSKKTGISKGELKKLIQPIIQKELSEFFSEE